MLAWHWCEIPCWKSLCNIILWTRYVFSLKEIKKNSSTKIQSPVLRTWSNANSISKRHFHLVIIVRFFNPPVETKVKLTFKIKKTILMKIDFVFDLVDSGYLTSSNLIYISYYPFTTSRERKYPFEECTARPQCSSTTWNKIVRKKEDCSRIS